MLRSVRARTASQSRRAHSTEFLLRSVSGCLRPSVHANMEARQEDLRCLSGIVSGSLSLRVDASRQPTMARPLGNSSRQRQRVSLQLVDVERRHQGPARRAGRMPGCPCIMWC
jgi:hypothetical protein